MLIGIYEADTLNKTSPVGCVFDCKCENRKSAGEIDVKGKGDGKVLPGKKKISEDRE